MRIRKRQVPFSLSPVTLSDPNLINRSPVLVQLNDVTTTLPKPSCTHVLTTALDPPQPSDQPLPPIGKPTNGCDDSFGESGLWQHKNQTCLVEDKEGGQKGNDTRKGGIFGAEMSTEVFSPSSPSSSKQDLWCEGEKAFPLKKRRVSFENNINNKNDNNTKKKMKMKSKMKINMNKKCDDSNEEEEEEKEVVRETKAEVKVGKKKIRGGALMEGSRCSRVNGRGWRCCQPTLVGYSLCEHHLGKGRLRSMTSVRNRSLASAADSAPKINNLEDTPLSESSLSVEKEIKCDDKDGDEKKPVIITNKKRMKLGMVKARSISSLLGQTNTTHEIAISENNKPISPGVLIAKETITRLTKVMDLIFSPNQLAFIRSCKLENGVVVVEKIVDLTKKMGNKYLTFKTNFEKTFDSVDWDICWGDLDLIWSRSRH